jgi:tRNA (cytidine/uridine-2'-O-)-methyltransferase
LAGNPIPDTPSLALYEPEIPTNAGNIARLCAATGSSLHLIGRLGFSFRHPGARRAGMDYWERVDLHRHLTYQDFQTAASGRRIWAFTTKASVELWDARFTPEDFLLYGPESRGLPEDLLRSGEVEPVRIPMVPGNRSLNLASAAAIGLYEALRQVRQSPESAPAREGK